MAQLALNPGFLPRNFVVEIMQILIQEVLVGSEISSGSGTTFSIARGLVLLKHLEQFMACSS